MKNTKLIRKIIY